jgi:hypothetical protein
MLWLVLALLPVAVGLTVGRWWALIFPVAGILLWLVGWAILSGTTDWVGFAGDFRGTVLFMVLLTESGILVGLLLRRLLRSFVSAS